MKISEKRLEEMESDWDRVVACANCLCAAPGEIDMVKDILFPGIHHYRSVIKNLKKKLKKYEKGMEIIKLME